MARIHINSFIGDVEPLETNNLSETFKACAEKLEKMATQYREVAEYIKDKQVKVVEAEGYPQCGSFSVDEIDTERLKQTGHVVDVESDADIKDPLFSIDPHYDELLESFKNNPMWRDAPIPEGNPTEELPLPDTSVKDLSALLFQQDIDFDGSQPGAIDLEVHEVSEDSFIFNLKVQDFGADFPLVDFNRETATFLYQCDTCETTHEQTLDAVLKSLKTASALLSNIVHMVEGSPELGMAITSIDDDLRLLKHLLSLDYDVDEENSDSV